MNELVQIGPISPLRQRLLDDMALRRFGLETQRNYLRDVSRFATWLQRSPHTATAEDIRQFQFEQLEAGVPAPTMNSIVAALRFFFTHTLDRPDLARKLIRTKQVRKIPVVLTMAEVKRLAPKLEQAFGGDPAGWSTANLLNAYRRVDTGHIRVEADEISYPLHIILRYRIERALLSEDLAIADLPGAWSDLSQDLLGRRPPSHSLGCLQDIHWAAGLFGYFPNYALGACLAAQLFETAVREDAAVLDKLSDGDFAPYRAWIGPRFHARASEVPFTTLVEDATGAPLSTESLKRHLRRRYLEETIPT